MLIPNKELKKVLEQIVDEEKKEHNIEFDFHYIGKLTYFKKMEEISKIKMNRLSKIINALIYFSIGGFQNQKNKIIVLFNSILVTQRYLIFTLYHEIKHAIDHSKEHLNLSNYDNFIYALDRKYC